VSAMLPKDLKIEDFAGYPAQSRRVVTESIAVLRQLPASFLPSLLREAIDYDYRFPAEQIAIRKELAALTALPPEEFHAWFQGFAQISLSASLEAFDWVNQPAQFVEQQSAYLWTTHQLDAFRKAATEYGDRLQAAIPAEKPVVQPLGIAVIGQGVDAYDAPLFRNLRGHGTYFSRVQAGGGFQQLLEVATQRAQKYPAPYGHWYVDGGDPAPHSSLLTCVSYKGLEPVRTALLKNIDVELKRAGLGPEELRTHMARLTPSDLGMSARTGSSEDEVLNRFQLKVLTEGSGTQIFSTTFAQWTTREALRRAQPLTMLVRFAPRQRQKPMNEMLANIDANAELDPIGSLVDGDMAAYYHWINQQRMPGAEKSSFVVWFEEHGQALAISPSLPRGTESKSPLDLAHLLAIAAG
jgi:hypothetical protein